MGLYERIWKDEKNRTLLIGSIIALAVLILAFIFSGWNQNSAPSWLKGLYLDDPTEIYNVGLTILVGILVSIFYFFLMLALATLREIRAGLPSWGSFVSSSVTAILITWIITSIKTGLAQETNYTTAMQWTIFGMLILTIILSIVYIFFTESPDEEKKKK